jgi:hypothetical protein
MSFARDGIQGGFGRQHRERAREAAEVLGRAGRRSGGCIQRLKHSQASFLTDAVCLPEGLAD